MPKSFPFEVESHSSGGRFSIPKKALKAIDISEGAIVDLVVQDAETDEVLFAGQKEMKSGPEIYGTDMKKIGKNQKLKVTVSRIE